jgi:hypothetical protein
MLRVFDTTQPSSFQFAFRWLISTAPIRHPVHPRVMVAIQDQSRSYSQGDEWNKKEEGRRRDARKTRSRNCFHVIDFALLVEST